MKSATVLTFIVLAAPIFGRKLLQNSLPMSDFSDIQWPNPGRRFDQDFYRRSVGTTADRTFDAGVDRDTFTTTMVNVVMASYPMSQNYNVFMCDIEDSCSPSFTGGPYNGHPAFAQLNGYYGTNYGVWVFSNGRADDCNSRNTDRSHWFFDGGDMQSDDCTFVW